jgi:hypothetical protein
MKTMFPWVSMLLIVAMALPAMGRQHEPSPVEQIIYARPFTVEDGYVNLWHKDKPVVSSGYVVVLRVGRDLAQPRAVATPLLYGGNGPIERIDNGRTGEYVVGLVPGEVDLANTLFWFGAPGYASEQGAGEIVEARWRAVEAGITSPPAEMIQRAVEAGGDPLVAADKADLLQLLAPLVDRFTPKKQTD